MDTAPRTGDSRARSERWVRRTLLAAAPLLGLTAAGVLALEARGSFDGTVVVLVLAILLGGPALLLGGGCLLLRALWPHRWVEDAAALGLSAALFFAATLPSVPLGRALGEGDRAEARTYARALVSLVERDRRDRGEYPESAAPLLARLGPPPRLFREAGWFYERRGDGFVIGYRDPVRMTGGVLYSGPGGRWRRWG